MDPFAVGALVISVLALAASLTGLRYAKEANRIARESNAIAHRAYEAENIPKISVQLRRHLLVLEEDRTTQAYSEVILAVVSNEGKIPVEFSHAYIAKPDTGGAYAFGIVSDNSDINDTIPFPELPYTLNGRNRFEVPASGDTLAKILPMLRAEPETRFVFRVVDSLGNRYDSSELRAGDYMEKKRFHVAMVPEEDER